MMNLDSMNLPEIVKKWLHSCGAMECRPYSKVMIGQKAYMKLKPTQKEWFVATAKQVSVIDVPAFEWNVKMKMNPLMWVSGRDTFVGGRGHMVIKLFSFVKIVNASGGKIDEGTMQRYLGEMVWMPALALSPYITWEKIDDLSARATMDYMGTTGSGVFHFDRDGNFMKFVAMRFRGNEEGSVRCEWVLTVKEHARFEGVKIPSRMEATWMLEEGPWTWLRLEIKGLSFE